MTHFFFTSGEHSARERRLAFMDGSNAKEAKPTPAVPEATNNPAEKLETKTELPLKAPDARSVDAKATEVRGKAESRIAGIKGKLGISNNKDGGKDINAKLKLRVSLPSGEKLQSGIKSTWEKLMSSMSKKGKGPDAKNPKAKGPDAKSPEAKGPDAAKVDQPKEKGPDIGGMKAAVELLKTQISVGHESDATQIVDQLNTALLKMREMDMQNTLDALGIGMGGIKLTDASSGDTYELRLGASNKVELNKVEKPKAEAPQAKSPEAKASDAKSPDAKAPATKGPDTKVPGGKSADGKGPESKGPDADGSEGKGEKSNEKRDGNESREKAPDTPRGKAIEATRKMLAENPSFKAKMETLRPMLDGKNTYNDMDPKAISLMRALDTSITLRLAKEGMSEEDIIAAKETIPFSPKGTADFMDEAGVLGADAGVDKGANGDKGGEKGKDAVRTGVEGKEKAPTDQLKDAIDALVKEFPQLKEIGEALKKLIDQMKDGAKAETKTDGPAKDSIKINNESPDKAKTEIAEREKKMKDNEGDIKDIDGDIQKAEEDGKTLDGQKKGIEQNLKVLRDDPKSSKADIRRMETNLKNVNRQIESNGERIKELKGQRQELVDANAKLKTEIDSLRAPDKKGPAEGGDKNKDKVDQAVKDLNLQKQPDGSFLRPGFTGRYTSQADGTIFYAGGKGPDNTDRPPQTFTGMVDGKEQWDQTRSTPLADTKAAEKPAATDKPAATEKPAAADKPAATEKPAEGGLDSRAVDGLKTALGALGDAVKVQPDGSAQIDLNSGTDSELVKAGMRAALDALGIPNDGGKVNVTKENIQKITQAAPQVVDIVNKLRSGKLSELPKDVLNKVIASIDAQLPENMRGKVTIDGSNVVLDLGELGQGKALPGALKTIGVVIEGGKVRITPAQVAKVAGAIKTASGLARFLRPRKDEKNQ